MSEVVTTVVCRETDCCNEASPPDTTCVIVRILTVEIDGGQVNVEYSFQLQAFGGTTPYIWTLVSGTFPDGLTLSESGLISGTPTEDGNFEFTVKIEDVNSNTCTQDLEFTIAPPVCALIDHFDCTRQTLPNVAAQSIRLRWRYTPNASLNTTVQRSPDNINWTTIGTAAGLSVQSGTGFNYNQTFLDATITRNTQYYYRVKPSTCSEFSSVLSVRTLATTYQVVGMTDCLACTHGAGPDSDPNMSRSGADFWFSFFNQFDINFDGRLQIIGNNWRVNLVCDPSGTPLNYFVSNLAPFPDTIDHCPWVMPDSITYIGDGGVNQCPSQVTLIPV